LKPYESAVAAILNEARPATILDAPSGSGWLRPLLRFDTQVDGLDLFAPPPGQYRHFRQADLDAGLPEDLGIYDAIVCCEGIEHLGNPDLFFKSAFAHLASGGRLIVTTPNVWHPAARLQYLFQGFFPGFPPLVGHIQRGTHMHVMPWSFPQLFLFLRRNGLEDIMLHDSAERKPKRSYERLLGLPQSIYCRRKYRQSRTSEEREFWSCAGSPQSLYSRRLIVSAVKPGPMATPTTKK
jgi:SAM-dependent methyltransferase